MKSSVFLVLLLVLFERSVQAVDQKPQRQDDFQLNANEGQHEKHMLKSAQQTTDCCYNTCAELKELRDMVTEQRVGMQILQEKLAEQGATLKSTQEELSITKNELESRMVQVEGTLEDNAKQLRVAFSVALTDSGAVGPFNTETTLVYQKIFYNLGQAYNAITGIFTAPKKGVYYFTFTGFNNERSSTRLRMYHNQKQLQSNWGPDAYFLYYSNAITIQMEEGDVLYMRLPAGFRLYDDYNNYCTLTGFLLFTL